jgi:hypothetical protein
MALGLFMIVKDEAELVTHALAGFEAIIQTHPVSSVAIIDNGSTDDTPQMVQDWIGGMQLAKRRIDVHHVTMAHTPRHGVLRSRAINLLMRSEPTHIFYLDGDETITTELVDSIRYAMAEPTTGPRYTRTWTWQRRWSIGTRRHYITDALEAAQCRMFLAEPGVCFPQNIHTEPMYPTAGGLRRGLESSRSMPGLIIDHTSCKSWEALRKKGERYAWAVGEAYVSGNPDEYVNLTMKAYRENRVSWFPEDVVAKMIAGPEVALHVYPRPE